MLPLLNAHSRKNDFMEADSGASLGLGIAVSIFFHVFMVFIFLILTNLWTAPAAPKQDFVIIQLSDAGPQAPAAPAAKVNENIKGPDVVELPAAEPQPIEAEPPQAKPTPPIEAPKEELTPILKPDIKEKTPEIKPKPDEPPKVEPVNVKEKEKKIDPKPIKPKPQSGTSDPLAKRLKEMERRVQSRNADSIIESRVANIAREHGGGDGNFSQGGQSRGTALDPEKEAYYRHIRDIVSSNWVAPQEAASFDLFAIYQLRIEPDGRISSTKLIKSSGIEEYDLAVLRALNKSSPLPPLPPIFGGIADTPAMRFNPQR